MRKQMTSERVLLLLKILLTVAALGIAFKDIAFSDLVQILHTQNHLLLLFAAFFLGIQIVLGGERWRMVLYAIRQDENICIAPRQAQKIYYVSNFFTCCLPGAVGGDVIRILMARGADISTSLSVYSVLIDRMVALISIGIFVLVMLPVLAEIIPINVFAVYALSLLVICISIVLFIMSEKILLRLSQIKFTGMLLHFTRMIKTIFKQPKILVTVVLMALIAHASYAVSGYYIAQSLNIEMSLLQSLALIPVIMLVITIPISIGGWGVREAAMVSLLKLIGVPAELSVMLSLQMGFLFIIVSLPGSLLWLRQRRNVPDKEEVAMQVDVL